MAQTAFDRALSLTEMPDVLCTKPTTIQASNALLGHTGTHIVQTARHKEDGFTLFLSVIDESSESGASVVRVVLPDIVCRTIYRQRQSLIDRARRKPAPKLTPEQRKAARIRDARRTLRELKSSK